MKKVIFVIVATLLFGCGPSKQNEPKKEEPKKDSVAVTITEPETADSSTLDDLVYEGVGASVLKIESNARSQAELKGRTEIIKALAADAAGLLKIFIPAQKGFFVDNVNADNYAKKVEEALNKSTTLRGSKVSEYSQSPKKDTTYAMMEMPLMNGYEEIEKVIVEVGQKEKFLKAEHADHFRMAFKDFFLAEKKKLLTEPS